MKKPQAELDRMREWVADGAFRWPGNTPHNDGTAILAYLDSLKLWPADLTRERLRALGDALPADYPTGRKQLHQLAELAPEREKRMVNLWRYKTQEGIDFLCEREPNWLPLVSDGWRKVGGPFEIEG